MNKQCVCSIKSRRIVYISVYKNDDMKTVAFLNNDSGNGVTYRLDRAVVLIKISGPELGRITVQMPEPR